MEFSTSDISCCVLSIECHLSHLLEDCEYTLYLLHSEDMASLASSAAVVKHGFALNDDL